MGAVSRCLNGCRIFHGGRELVPYFSSYKLLQHRFDRSIVSACAVVANAGREAREKKNRSMGRVPLIVGGSFVGVFPSRSCYCLDASIKRGLEMVNGSLWNSTPAITLSSSKSIDLQKRHASFSTSAGEVVAKTLVGGIQKKNDKTLKESTDEKIADMKILQTLMKNLWLKDNLEFRMRVMVALSLLVGAKVLNVQVPFLFKIAVDWLSAITAASDSLSSFNESNSLVIALLVSPAAVLIGYGIARVGSSACNELRNAVFSKVALRAIRTVSRKNMII